MAGIVMHRLHRQVAWIGLGIRGVLHAVAVHLVDRVGVA